MHRLEKLQLAEDLAEHIVEKMDIDSLVQYAIDSLKKEYNENYTDEQLITEVKEYAPYLLETERE